jgi:AcrR family transcriptional regulator
MQETLKRKNSGRKNSHRFESILDAAAKIFREKGYHHANISDIAAETGLLKGSLYHYIANKEELLYEIIMSALKLEIAALNEILTKSNERPDVVLEKAIIAHMTPIDLNHDRVAVFINEISNLSPRLRKEVSKEVEKYEKLWLRILQQGKKDQIFRKGIDPKIILLSIYGMCNWTNRWFNKAGKYSAHQLGEIYAATILEGIRSK